MLFFGEQLSGSIVITSTEYPWVSAAHERSKSTRPIHCLPAVNRTEKNTTAFYRPKIKGRKSNAGIKQHYVEIGILCGEVAGSATHKQRTTVWNVCVVLKGQFVCSRHDSKEFVYRHWRPYRPKKLQSEPLSGFVHYGNISSWMTVNKEVSHCMIW